MVLLAFIAQPFLSLWAGKVYGVNSTHLFYIMVVGVWFNAAGWLPAYFLSLDHLKRYAKLHVIEIVPYVIAVTLLTSRFGVTGTAVAWSARVTIEAIALFLMARQAGGVTISPLSANRVRSVVFPLTFGVVLLLLSMATASLPARVGYAVLASVLYAALVWRLGLTQREREGLQTLSPIGRFARPSAAS